ncbi:MAG: DUF559 domain-containing protein [Methanogenium sp.]|jgi:very-short-patch-repair endonuclease
MYTHVCQNQACRKEFKARERNRKYCSHICANVVITKSLERNKKVSISNKGRIVSTKTRLQLSLLQKGKKPSPESIQKMKETKLRNKKPRTLETRLKIKNTLKRKITSGEIKPSQLGKKSPCPEERRLKISKSAKLWWENHKGVKRNIDYVNMKHSNVSRSRSEIAWGEYIERIYDVKLTHSFKLDRFIYDYRYKKFLFEIDGSYWHKNTLERDLLKTDIADDNGFILYRFTVDNIKEALESIKYHKNYLDFIFKKQGDLNNA